MRTTDEIIALWTAVFGEPPPIRTDGPSMIAALVASLPEAGQNLRVDCDEAGVGADHAAG